MEAQRQCSQRERIGQGAGEAIERAAASRWPAAISGLKFTAAGERILLRPRA